MKYLLIITLFFLGPNASAQADSVKVHIDSSLSILKNNSLYAAKVNWKQIRKKVFEKAKTAQNRQQTFEAMKIAFDALGDKHAAYYQYDDQYRLDNPGLVARYSDSIRAAWARGPRVYGKMMGNIAYVSVPFLGVTKQTDIDYFGNLIYSTVADLSQKKPNAWIIDLRLNGGGNIRPMLGGLAPFFDNGAIGYYIDRNGKVLEESSFKDGEFLMDGKPQATIKSKTAGLDAAKVAVLIGVGTGSSGEGVAAAFQQRKNTRLFGENTAGMANSTNGFVFNNNKSYYLISTAYLGDRNKKRLPEVIEPDVRVKANDAFANPSSDTVLVEAVKWLNN